MTIQEYITQKRPLLHKHMREYIGKKKSDMASLPLASQRLDELLEFALGGKNLRGIQLLLAHDTNGGRYSEVAFDLAVAVELTHGAGLTHDDIVDNDGVRHGKPSIYAAHMQEAQAQSLRNPLLFGQSQAIWLGDLGFFLSFELTQSLVSHPQGARIIRNFTQGIQQVCIAEMNETIYASSSYEPTEQEILNMYLYKTGIYSIVMPLTLGALLANSPDATVSVIEQFGTNVGIIFQMKDDEMGLFGDETVTGKPVGSDIRENKKTLYRALLFQRASQREQAKLMRIFGKEAITPADIQVVSDLIEQYGIKQEIESRLKNLEEETISILDSFNGPDEFKTLLHQFLQMNLKRTK